MDVALVATQREQLLRQQLTIKRGSATISNTGSVELNQQPSKKQASGGNGGSGTEESNRLISDDNNRMEEERPIRTRVLQLQVKMHGTLQATQICLKRKGVLDLVTSTGAHTKAI